ncbi:MAG TPA: hypothetical protein VFN88_03100 [Caulobacteraceae bacterium]|nr:hypothetical protein [Caulobacteraceae bacterium]
MAMGKIFLAIEGARPGDGRYILDPSLTLYSIDVPPLTLTPQQRALESNTYALSLIEAAGANCPDAIFGVFIQEANE